ncbi:MAG: ABC transporter permease [Bryobacteraceae bacterium]
MSWKKFVHRRRWDEERRRELEAHIENETQENLARGMSPADARAAANRLLGNATQIREDIYHMNTLQFAEELWKDLRHGLRLLLANPGFTVVAVTSLALGIGANTAIFQLLDAVRLRTLPVKDPQQLVSVDVGSTRGAWGRKTSRFPFITYPLWEQLRAHQEAFSQVAAWGSEVFNLSSSGESRLSRNAIWVTGEFFQTLGVTPVLGRVFSAEEDRAGCGAVAGSTGIVISHAFWQREFGGASAILGRVMTIDGNRLPVIGVTPLGFSGVEVGRGFDFALPVCLEPVVRGEYSYLKQRNAWWLAAIGRLKPGWTPQRASAHLSAISPGLFDATIPERYDAGAIRAWRNIKFSAKSAASGYSYLRLEYETPLWLLLGIAGLVLVIACANLANLLLARAAAREREIAVRLAVGASRGRIIRQLLAESLLLAGIGSALGALLARGLSGILVTYLGTSTDPVFVDLRTDWRMLAFTMAMAVLTCVLTGLTPAIRATRTDPAAAMKSGGRGSSEGRERHGLRRALVVVQVALSLVLVFGAALFVRTLRNLATLDAGFRQSGILITNVDFGSLKIPPDRRGVYKVNLAQKLAGLRGVDAAATTNSVPASGNNWIQSVVVDKEKKGFTNLARIGPRYFETMGTRMLSGRDISERDRAGAPRVAIVNEMFVEKYFSGQNPVGRTFELGEKSGPAPDTFEVIGTVANTKYNDLREDFVPIAFLAEPQDPKTDLSTQIVIRSGAPLADVIAEVRQALTEADPAITYQFQVFETEMGNTLLRERLMATLSGFFGGLAALLAAIGLYGVISYMAARRKNEIGIRLALGASRSQVTGMVLREAGVLVACGLLAGAALSIAAANAVASLLYGLTPRDPATMLAAAVLLAAAAFLAAYLPARRAALLDPMDALREE